MGIDISGGMIVGANAESVKNKMYDKEKEVYGIDDDIFEEFYEWYEFVGLDAYSSYFDADYSGQVVGFIMNDVEPLSQEFEEWVKSVKEAAQEFHKLTGLRAELIGMQNVW